MGRAKSNTKRRPKGKRGWRKIDAASLITTQKQISLEEEESRISKLRDSQLWQQDMSPRKVSKLRKSQKKLKAKRQLLSRGCIINSIESNNKLNEQISAYKKQERLSAFKERQKTLKNNQYNINAKQPKKTSIIKFKNKTSKKITLNNHENIALNKKHIQNNIDYHKNNPYNLYKTKHNNKNTRNAHIQDLWNDHNDNNNNYNNNNNNNDQSSDSETVINDNNNNNNNNALNTDLSDIKPWKIIKKQDKASKGDISGCRAVQNMFIPSSSLISLPNAGESINPLNHQYYYLKWKALELKTKQLFKEQYQNKSTLKWYRDNIDTDHRLDDTLKQLKTKANKMRKLYYYHYKLYKEQQRKLVLMNRKNGKRMDNDNDKREISWKERINDIKTNRKNMNKRRNVMTKRIKISKKSGGFIYGSKYRFKPRATPLMSSDKINNCLRRTVHSGIDNPLSFMFNEMQKQNKIHGSRRNRFVFPRKRGFHGPRYRVQTRIGKLHHANVGNKYFSGIDDLEQI